MKTSLVIFAFCVGVALAQGTSICLPNQFQWQREQQFSPQGNNGFGGFDLSEEWYDYVNKNTRNRGVYWQNNEQFMLDYILIGSAGKLYTVNATKGSGVVTCTVQKAVFPPTTPCLFANATLYGSAFVAGDVFCNIWFESATMGNTSMYQDVTLTAEDNVPISSREYYSGYGTTLELYANYALNLDPDAFKIPEICPDQTTVEGEVPEAQLRAIFKRLHTPKN